MPSVSARFHYGNIITETTTPVTSPSLPEAIRAAANIIDPASGSRLAQDQIDALAHELSTNGRAEHGWITFTLALD